MQIFYYLHEYFKLTPPFRILYKNRLDMKYTKLCKSIFEYLVVVIVVFVRYSINVCNNKAKLLERERQERRRKEEESLCTTP